ncbi:hypothetical protein SCT_0274 [Sulfuricella sp. T08]|nr:hypothetical protein SCT_0274 [Sulfuricella sp. T08]
MIVHKHLRTVSILGIPVSFGSWRCYKKGVFRERRGAFFMGYSEVDDSCVTKMGFEMLALDVDGEGLSNCLPDFCDRGS